MIGLAVVICVAEVSGWIVAVIDDEIGGDAVIIDSRIVLNLNLGYDWAIPIIDEGLVHHGLIWLKLVDQARVSLIRVQICAELSLVKFGRIGRNTCFWVSGFCHDGHVGYQILRNILLSFSWQFHYLNCWNKIRCQSTECLSLIWDIQIACLCPLFELLRIREYFEDL